MWSTFLIKRKYIVRLLLNARISEIIKMKQLCIYTLSFKHR